MTDFSKEYTDAFNHLMLDEVGPLWNPKDPDVIAGSITTPEQKKKVGYVNIKQDTGGETKFGVAKNANPDLDITNLTMEQAMQVYFDRYWIPGKCDKLSAAVSAIHFDGCVNHGVGRANKFLQTSVGVTADGSIGPVTLNTISIKNQKEIVEAISALRLKFYNDIVANKPSQKVFLKGWTNRIKNITSYALSKI